MEMRRMFFGKSSRGVALLMALSVILVLSTALMKTFENRAVEVVHFQNTLQRFQAETLARSVFRAILIAIKEKGLIFVVNSQKKMPGVSLPIQDGTFQIHEIESLDHRFNLNYRFKSDGPRASVFSNIVERRPREENEPDDVFQEDIHAAMSAINDWTDTDDDQDQEFLYDFEQYPQEEPAFEVKNQVFNRLSELKILPPFRKLGLSTEYLEENFRVHGGEEKIDINLAEPGDVKAFLERYENVEGYQAAYDNRELLDEIATGGEEEEEEEEETLGLPSSEPRFPPPLGRNSNWGLKLYAVGLWSLLNAPGQKTPFSARTEYLAIRYSIQVDRITIVVKSIVHLLYRSSKSTEIKGIEILRFSIN
ncbi:MAG: hypothetical protein GY866_20050 [Proteobacteria bacterium]|nr:hypothetical protein [Pseudomonadota bacterium]